MPLKSGRQSKQIILYIPAVHAGNQALIEHHRDADELLVLGPSFHRICPEIGRDKRALKPTAAALYINQVLGITTRVVNTRTLPRAITAEQLVLGREAISRQLVATYELDKRHDVIYEPTFLFHDRPWS